MVVWKRILSLVIVATILGGGYWYYLVASYESEVGTNNTYSATDGELETSNSTEDELFSLIFDSGKDELDWAFTTMTLSDQSGEYGCTTGGLTSISQGYGNIETKLNADGQTFTLFVDATSEDTYTYLDISSMLETESSNYSMKFSSTNIFLGDNVLGLVVNDVEFSDLTNVPNGSFDENSEEKLDWYDYDISTHRVQAKNQIYILNDGNSTFKIQLLNYYNNADEPRHITVMIAQLGGEPIMALNNPSLIQESPCIISDNNTNWSPGEKISIYENGVDICNGSCILEISIHFEGVIMKGTSTVEIE